MTERKIVKISQSAQPIAGTMRGIVIVDGVVREAAQALGQFLGKAEPQAKAMIKANGWSAWVAHPKTKSDYWALGLVMPAEDSEPIEEAPLLNPLSGG